ncbi:TPA: site-specific integrase [Streptococcus agalactiae]|nr:site-specific integrase [Streptococcus agalactiae]HEO7923683.1 site-specific integrase [Streptococcus agalactiae]
MYIEELDDGKYKFIERYIDPLTGKKKRTSVTLDRKTKQAENKARSILQNRISKKINNVTKVELTYGELRQEYLKQWLPTVKNNTIKNNTRYDEYISYLLDDDVLISNITKATIRNIANELGDKKSYNVVSKCMKRLSAILNYAASLDYIQSNPAKSVKVIKPVENYDADEKIEFLTIDEMRELYVQMTSKSNKIRDLVVFMFLTGMRYGEVVALTTDKIDFENKTIKINATYDYDGKELTTPKTENSVRVISVSDSILSIVNDFIVHNRMNNLITDHIFVSRYGNPMSIRYVNKRLKDFMPEKQLKTHVFRHSHISYLAEKNVPLKAIMDRVGHKNAETTLKIYTHTTNNMKEYINGQTNINF